MQVPGWTYPERQGWNDLKQSLSSCWACVRAKSLQSCLTLCDSWTVAHQAPLSMGFSMQEYWSGLPFPPPRDLPNPGIEPMSLTSPALAGRFFTTSATIPWDAHSLCGLQTETLGCRKRYHWGHVCYEPRKNQKSFLASKWAGREIWKGDK